MWTYDYKITFHVQIRNYNYYQEYCGRAQQGWEVEWRQLWNLKYEDPICVWEARGSRNTDSFHGRARKWRYSPT